ncbi:T cell receptor beta variable 12-5 [Pelobates cultripes]|nr:T cell receptor beta variable 12-5 [Pelobates cultripes]
MQPIVYLLLTVVWLKCCFCADVIQTPKFKLSLPGENVTLKCEHSESSYLTKYWYQQKKERGLVFIGYTYSTDKPNMEKDFETKATIFAETAQKSHFTIYKVTIEDSAVYYCASSIHKKTPLNALAKPDIEIGCCQGGQVKVTQDTFLIVEADKEATIKCSYNDSSYITLFWYLQKEKEGVISMGYSPGEKSFQFEDDKMKTKWNVQRPIILESSLKISNLEVEDSAVYFCAVSTQYHKLKQDHYIYCIRHRKRSGDTYE